MSKEFKLIILFFFVALIYSCKKDNSSHLTGNLSAKINGNNFTPDSSFASLVIDSSLGIRAITIQGYKNDSILSVVRMDFELGLHLPVNVSYNDNSVSVSYDKDSSTAITNIVSRSFIITGQDTIHKLISGFFSADIANWNYSDTTYIRDGKFDNLPYEVMTSH